MKKTLCIILAVLSLVMLASCAAPSGTKKSDGKNVKLSEQVLEIDAVNYDVGDISGVTKIADKGVRYAYCVNIEGANSIINSLDAVFATGLDKYTDEDKEHLILVVVTVGEGTASKYSVGSVDLGGSAEITVNVTTEGGTADDKMTGQYHFITLDLPVCRKVNVTLDGEKVGA